MVTKIFCNACNQELQAPESNEITVCVEGIVYYEGHLCERHWKKLMIYLDNYFSEKKKVLE